MDYFDSWDFELKGRQFRAFVHVDTDMGRPWEEEDGHGPVRDIAITARNMSEEFALIEAAALLVLQSGE